MQSNTVSQTFGRMAAQAEDVIDDDHTPSKAMQIVSDAVESFTEAVTKVGRAISGGSTSHDHDYRPVESNDQLELQLQPSLQVSDTSAPETSSGGAGMHPELTPSEPRCARSGGGNQDDPSSHPPSSSNGASIALPNPLCSSPGIRSRRRLYLVALVAILISAGTFFAWRRQQVTDANGTNPSKREREINSSDFFSPDANSSDFMVLNHSYVYFLNSSITAARSSCSYYSSCASCTHYDGCGWCVPSGRCSSGSEGRTSDSLCVGGYQGIDWIWYSNDCTSRCAVGSYSSTGHVCRPPLTTTSSLITDVVLVDPLPPSPPDALYELSCWSFSIH